MSVSLSRRRLLLRPATALILVLLAATLWAAVFFRQYHEAPVRRHIEAGAEYARLGQAGRAEQEWREAVRLDPNNAAAWELLGELALSTDNWTLGSEAFGQLARLKPDAPNVHGRLAACLLRSGDEVGAFKHAQEELKHDPEDGSSLLISALLLSNMGQLQREVEYLRRLLKQMPDDPDVLALLAETLTYTSNYAEARDVIGRLLKVAPDNAEAYDLRGVGWFNEDPSPQGMAQAESDLLKALRLNPLAPFPRLYLGKIYRRRNQPQKALFQLEEAYRLLPHREDILFELAGAYEQAGQPQKAAQTRQKFETMRQEADLVSSLEKKCKVYPDNFDYHLQLGLLEWKRGEYHKARAYLTRASVLRPADSRVNAALRKLASTTGAPDPRDALQAKMNAAAQGGSLR
jgi:tetratricopeptide (TPR) repeat protein